jgi:hypothetical protein
MIYYQEKGAGERMFQVHAEKSGQVGVKTQEFTRDQQDQWKAFLDEFSRNHVQFPVSVEVRGPSAEGDHWVTHQEPLLGIVAGADHNAGEIEVALGGPGIGPSSHVIRDVQKIWRQQDDKGRECLQFESRDGTVTILTVLG